MNQVSQPGSVGVVATELLDLPETLPLDSGAELSNVRIAYETYGDPTPERDNVILVCHALSGDAHAAGWAHDGAPTALDGIRADERGVRPKGGLGWWDGMIGPGKPFDTDRFHVVCTNLLGGCRGTTGPGSTNPATGRPYGSAFPVLTVGDMIRAQRRFLDELGIERVLCVTGASLGGMQALQWTIDFADDVDLCLAIASTGHLDARGIALNAVARNAIMADPDWQGGDYHESGRPPKRGLAVARQVGHITYLSRHAFAEKFGRALQERDDISYTLGGADFSVESYLRHQGSRFVERFDANTYLVTSRALTYFDLARQYGSLEQAFGPARAAFTLLSFSSDWMYPPADSEELAEALRGAGKAVEHVCLETTYGHDSFLLEEEAQAPHIEAALERALSRRRARV
jgi:homoserine O-acetyltransferase/O-succinyltransferase